MDENQNFQPTGGDGTYGYTPQQPMDNNQYGYQTQQPTDGAQYGYQTQQSMDSTQYGYQAKQPMDTMQYGYSAQAPMDNNQYGYPAQAPVSSNQYGYEQNTYGGQQLAPVMKVSDWIIMYLLMCVPCLNIILMFVWAFGDGANPNKKNYCKAMLLLTAIILALYSVFAAVIVAVTGASLSEMSRGY